MFQSTWFGNNGYGFCKQHKLKICSALIPRASECPKGWQGWQVCLLDFKTGRSQSKKRVLPPQYPSVIISVSGCPPFAIGIQSASKGHPSMPSPFLGEIMSGNHCFPLFFVFFPFPLLCFLALQSLMSLSRQIHRRFSLGFSSLG